MRRSLFGIATLFVGTATALVNAADPVILPVVDVCIQDDPAPIVSEGTPIHPRRMPMVNDAAMPRTKGSDELPAPCEACLPEPSTVFHRSMNSCCKRQPRFWIDASYMLWSVKDEPLNAVLFTQGPIAAGGVLGAPGVQPVFGGQDLDFGSSNGVRVEAGYWLNNTQTFGVEVSGFLLERSGTGFQLSSGPNDGQGISRSFFNPVPGVEDASLVTLPPQVLGGAFAWAATRFWGFDADAIINLRERSCYRIDALVGFDYLNLEETLIVGDTTNSPQVPGLVVSTIDSFATRNQFYGADFGIRGVATRGRVDFTATFKCGIGVTHEVAEIVGQSQVDTPAGSFSVPGGFLAVESNSGTLTRDRFAVAPEGILKVAYRITDHCSGFVGYNFLYLSNVMRPGDQVDRTVNPAQVPVLTGFNPTPVAQLVGPARPSADAVHGDFFAQGISLGLGLTY